jgi:hypothetical protein
MLVVRDEEGVTMAVPKPHGGPTADKDRGWSWSEEGGDQVQAMLDHGGWKTVAEAHAWYDDADGDPPEKKTAYKLPHHELIDGKLQVVWRGVTRAMNVLAGGRGGVDIPQKERRDVWRHLARHYEQFGEDPPDAP